MASFEDAVIFVHDVEHCLEELDEFSQKLIAKIVLQEYVAGRTRTIVKLLAQNRGPAFSRCTGSTQRTLSQGRVARAVSRFGRGGSLSRGRMLRPDG